MQASESENPFCAAEATGVALSSEMRPPLSEMAIRVQYVARMYCANMEFKKGRRAAQICKGIIAGEWQEIDLQAAAID